MENSCNIETIHKTITYEEKRKSQTANLAISGLNCPNCATRVRNALLNIYGVTDAVIDHIGGTGKVTFNPDLVMSSSLVEIVSMAGQGRHHSYSAHIMES